ncbi:RXLR effector domain-containing protein [Phytophthora infestans]|uniref:RxLR effector protein n=1 Tax=Phytophthora infestans TaxID=4787 RepID=A0A8S9VCR0_PHYIN|nr:RXLR effector domain-containing protein [Phytophthora infestans]
MRLSSVLPASIAIIYLVTCNAADPPKLSRMESPVLVHSLGAALNVDAVDRRFLRERKANFNKADDVYKKWNENSYSLNKIASLLKVSERKKFEPVYNGYLAYLNKLNS